MAAYCREMAKWGLRNSTKAQKNSFLSGVVYVVDGAGKGVCRIRFEDAFVDAVGLALPNGVSPEHPAYLKIVQTGNLWKVYAFYVGVEQGVLLWETDKCPSWLTRIKRRDSGKSQKNQERRNYPPAQEKVRSALRKHLRGLRG